MKPFWKKAPFFRILLPFIAGILIEYYIALSVCFVIVLAMAVLILGYLLQRRSPFHQFKYPYADGILAQAGCLLLGVVCTMCHELRFNPTHFSGFSNQGTTYCMRVEEPPVERAKTWKLIASVHHLIRNGERISVSGHCYIYIKKGEKIKQLQYGSFFYTQKVPERIPASPDTASFDFRQYAALQKIYHQSFLRDTDYVVSGKDVSFSIYEYLFRVRDQLIMILHRYIPDPQQSAVAIALLTGYRAELDRSTTALYQATGTIHVIAISGMHLALIYVLLQFFFRFLEKSKQANLVKEGVVLILLWLFSLLTGGGASVIRAVIMFSFISFGKLLQKEAGIENALAGSAFFMLCFRPYLLWDIGFQLSYAAVLSLVIFMKPIYNLIAMQNPLLKAIWKMNAVTLSAQVLTLPLCIYHFHQMPVLFLPANIMAIPISTLALYGLLLLTGVSFYFPVAVLLGQAIGMLIGLMNVSMAYVDRFRFAVIHDLHPTLAEIILLYCIIFSVFLFFSERRKYYLFTAMLLVFCMSVLRLVLFFLHKH